STLIGTRPQTPSCRLAYEPLPLYGKSMLIGSAAAAQVLRRFNQYFDEQAVAQIKSLRPLKPASAKGTPQSPRRVRLWLSYSSMRRYLVVGWNVAPSIRCSGSWTG